MLVFILVLSSSICHKRKFESGNVNKTNQSKQIYRKLCPSQALALEPNFSVSCWLSGDLVYAVWLPPLLPHLGDFRSNLSGACPSISLSTLSITVQHCQGNQGSGAASSRALAPEQTVITLPRPQKAGCGGGWLQPGSWQKGTHSSHTPKISVWIRVENGSPSLLWTMIVFYIGCAHTASIVYFRKSCCMSPYTFHNDVFVIVPLSMWAHSGPWTVYTGAIYRSHLKTNVNSQND